MSAPSARAWRRQRWFGLLTVLGAARRGFFIPHRYADRIPRAGTRPAYAAVDSRLAARAGAFREVLGWIEALAPDLMAIGAGEPPAPRWAQSWFPRLDAAAAYALTRRLSPGGIVEVGAGHSTRFLARAIADGRLATRHVAIDPEPRVALDGLGVEVVRRTIQEAGVDVLAEIRPGDFLMIDSSHILMPGTDVDMLLGRVLPGLPAGALVHIHDIFLPDDYPPSWEWRGYNEQLGVLPLILGDRWEVVFASHYVASRMAEELAGTVISRLPIETDARETSLWLRAR